MATARETRILISSTSPVGFDDAIREAALRAAARLKGVRALRVRELRVLLDGGAVTGYRVEAEVAFAPVDGDEREPEGAFAGPPYGSPEHEADPVPLRFDEEGTARVGGTRVTLDSVVSAFRDGEPAEGIAGRFPSLALGDVYAVLGWCLRHQRWVDAYMARRDEEASLLREEAGARFGGQLSGLRERLLARRGAPD
jgi:flavin-binding protein dodecin/uncharacterized protein (DUF433 family)